MVTIDHIVNIAVDESVGNNELKTLRYLSVGLARLAGEVAHFEALIQKRQQELNYEKWVFGNAQDSFHSVLPPDAVDILPCLFHWFGVSVINYARLVGFLSGLASKAFDRESLEDEKHFCTVDNHCNTYIDSIPELAPVKVWRNKVAAHIAITAPRKKQDNVALLDFSVMYPVGFDSPRLRVNLMELILIDSSGVKHRGTLPSWSVTEVFEILQSRYWYTNSGDCS